jgi:hypothetical protein
VLGCGFDIDVIDTNPGTTDHAKIGTSGNHCLRHFRPAADNQTVIWRNELRELLNREPWTNVYGQLGMGTQPF